MKTQALNLGILMTSRKLRASHWCWSKRL